MAFTARELLARIIQCEAGGEGETGMQAVATFRMNRRPVAGGEHLRTRKGDIPNDTFQTYQIDCARTEIGGQYNSQNIYNMSPEGINYEIADWALGGNSLGAVGDCLWYFNPFSSNCDQFFPRNGSGIYHTRIGQHCFYRPTSQYWQT